jgi:hypothetical protein
LTASKKDDAGLTYSDIPAFIYDFSTSYSTITPAAVYGRAGYITFNYLQCGREGCTFYQCQNVGLSGILSVQYRNEQKGQWRNQSGTGIRGPSLVLECSDSRLRYRMPECRCPAIQNGQKTFFLIIKNTYVTCIFPPL